MISQHVSDAHRVCRK